MLMSKFLDPKNDLAFKRIFGSEKNKDILIHFLNDIFAKQTGIIEEVTFLKTFQEPEVASQRVSIVDIMCQAVNGDHFIIEMQVQHEAGFEKRAQYYAARAYINQRQKGTEYKDLQQVIFLAITEFTIFPNKPGFLCHHQVLDIESGERDLKDFSFSFLELPKFTKDIDQLKTMTDKWAYFFKNADCTSEADLKKIVGSDQIIERAFEELNRFSWKSGDLLNYDSVDMKICADKAVREYALEYGKKEGIIEGKKEGIIEGKKEGIIEGKLEEKYETARFLIKEKYAFETIARITRLSVEQIKNL